MYFAHILNIIKFLQAPLLFSYSITELWAQIPELFISSEEKTHIPLTVLDSGNEHLPLLFGWSEDIPAYSNTLHYPWMYLCSWHL